MKKIIGVGMVLMLVLVGLFSGCYEKEISLPAKIGNHVYVDYRYYDCDISTDFVTSSECFWMFSITLTNKTRNEVVTTFYGYYDECNDQLYDNDYEKIDKIRWG